MLLAVIAVLLPAKHSQQARDFASTSFLFRWSKILCDLKTDSLISPGDQGDGFVLHSNLLFSVDAWPTLPCYAFSSFLTPPIESRMTITSGGSCKVAASRFSRRCLTEDVPGISRMLGARYS